MIQVYHSTLGQVYAIRMWRVVLHLDRGPESCRHGGIVTVIGDAHFLFWRVSVVGAKKLSVRLCLMRQARYRFDR